MQTQVLQSKDNLISIRIDAPLTEAQSQAVRRQIEQTAERAGKVRLLLLMRHYPSLNSPEDLYDDLKFIMLEADRIDKVAVVLDLIWKRTFLGLFSLFSHVNLKCFEISEMGEAQSWLASSSRHA